MRTSPSSRLARIACLSLVSATALLQGCGQKGPLYRADEQAQTVDEESATSGKKKSPTLPPAPQTQKVPAPSEPATPPQVDPDRPANPPPNN